MRAAGIRSASVACLLLAGCAGAGPPNSSGAAGSGNPGTAGSPGAAGSGNPGAAGSGTAGGGTAGSGAAGSGNPNFQLECSGPASGRPFLRLLTGSELLNTLNDIFSEVKG